LGQSLRILSANLWAGKADPEAFADLVGAMAVDVVACQEIDPAQAEALRGVLPYGLFEPDERFRGMALALRRPGQAARVPMHFRDARVAWLSPRDWPEIPTPLEIINVHIIAPHLGFIPIWPLLQRRRQLASLEGYLANGHALRPFDLGAEEDSSPGGRVLIGDFNATPIWGVYRRIASQLTDAAIAVAQQSGRPVRSTWGPWHGSPRLLRIDHGFVSGLRVDEFQVVDVLGSDHSAIVMDLSFDRVD
jgi:endonuclease/exonuclease/phosphatase family metal-dependent hydrolase